MYPNKDIVHAVNVKISTPDNMAKVIQKQVSFNTERVVRYRFKSSLTYTKLVKKIRY